MPVPDEVVHRLAAACRTGDAEAIEAALSPAAVAVCDSGGRVPAPLLPLVGAGEVTWLLQTLLPETDLMVQSVNGGSGLVLRRSGRALAVIAVTCDQDHVTALWVVLNPNKLRGWNSG
ncbi:siderophore-interacting protein [Actinoplanes sp. NPDC048791]|uniref:siderophore-interacting protein n=1 Tax=Actinoplanes sp. NPDC048791 TaxID=3154623 RepID=UPI00340270B6